MKTIRVEADLTYDDELMHGTNPDAVRWFHNEILQGRNLILHDNGDIGDSIGALRVIEILNQ